MKASPGTIDRCIAQERQAMRDAKSGRLDKFLKDMRGRSNCGDIERIRYEYRVECYKRIKAMKAAKCRP